MTVGSVTRMLGDPSCFFRILNALFTENKTKSKHKEGVGDRGAHENGPKAGICDKCGEVFESRSKLFGHLKESGHASLKGPAILPLTKADKKAKRK